MNRRYQHAPSVLTSNMGFEQWGEVLGDDVIAAALIDRVLHHYHLVNIRSNSYRMREHTELHRALLQSDVEEPSEAVTRPRRSKVSVALKSSMCAIFVRHRCDDLYLSRGRLATNGELVARAKLIIESVGCEVASPDEARQILGLKHA